MRSEWVVLLQSFGLNCNLAMASWLGQLSWSWHFRLVRLCFRVFCGLFAVCTVPSCAAVILTSLLVPPHQPYINLISATLEAVFLPSQLGPFCPRVSLPHVASFINIAYAQKKGYTTFLSKLQNFFFFLNVTENVQSSTEAENDKPVAEGWKAREDWKCFGAHPTVCILFFLLLQCLTH